MLFLRFNREIFAKRFYSSQSPLQQEIKYSLKEFLEKQEERINASLDTKLELFRNDIKSSLEAKIAQSESRTLRWVVGVGVFIFIEVWQTRNGNGNGGNNHNRRQSERIVRGLD